LQLERARIASETLAALGLPALVLNQQGKVIAANSLIEALTGHVQWRAFDRVSLKDKAADNLLRNTILTQLRGVMEKTGCNRQADVVALLIAISPARLTHPA